MANQSSRIVLFGVTIAIIVALISSVAGPKVAKRTIETGRRASHVEKPASSSVREVAPSSLSPDAVVSAWMRSLAVPAHPGSRTFL